MSQRRRVYARKEGMICGTTPKRMVWIRLAPVAVSASTGPGSICSISSEYSLPRAATEWIVKAITPANVPSPTQTMTIRPQTTVSTERTIFKIVRLT